LQAPLAHPQRITWQTNRTGEVKSTNLRMPEKALEILEKMHRHIFPDSKRRDMIIEV
jgi:hypothetical protein